MDGLIRVSVSAAAGAAFGFGPELAHVAVIVPFAIGGGRGRPSFGCAAAYAAPAALPAGLAAFDYTGSIGVSLIAWAVPGSVYGLAVGAALAAPRPWRTLSVIVVIVAVSVPPLSAVALLSPVPVAGLVFPGAGVAGLIGFLVLLGVLASARSTPILCLSSACLVGSAAVATAATPRHADERGPGTASAVSAPIAGVDTSRGQPDARTRALLSGAWRTEERRISEALGAHTVVWPEGVYGEWSALTGQMLELATPRLVGGARSYVDERTYVNTLIDGVTGEVLYAQRSPVPLAFGRGHRAVPGERLEDARPVRYAAAGLSALLCIEIANPWLALVTFGGAASSARPVVWAANLGWSSRAGLATRMRQTARQWGALFDVPVVTAVNHPDALDGARS